MSPPDTPNSPDGARRGRPDGARRAGGPARPKQSGQGGGPGNGGRGRGRPGGGSGGGSGGRGSDGPRKRLNPAIQIGVVTPATPELGGAPEHFRLVEADASGTPLSERLVGAWLDRTPEQFTIDVRAHRILTHHPTPVSTLAPEVRDLLSPAAREKRSVYADELPARALDLALRRFVDPLRALHDFKKLGAVVLEFPSYFQPSAKARDYLAWFRDGAGDLPIAVEFRHRDWVASAHRDDTMAFLTEHQFAYVSVDTPPQLESSLPPLAVATTDLAVVRFHGRTIEPWEQAVDSGEEAFGYEYRRGDLEPWVARLEKLAASAKQVHVIMNTPRRDAATRNARLLVRVMTEPPEPKAPEPPRPTGRRPPHRR